MTQKDVAETFLFITAEFDPTDNLSEDPGPASKRPGFLGNSVTRCFFHSAHIYAILSLISQSVSMSLIHRQPRGQTVSHRPGQHAEGAGPGSVQQEVRRGTGHQVSRASALQEDQEQPRLGDHRGPAAGHPLQEALHVRLAEP